MFKSCASLLIAALLSACGGGSESPTAAKVNREAISEQQIELVLQRQPNLKPEQLAAARRPVLERLIDQELAVQQAEQAKLDRDPQVVMQIDAAKREILARAYAEKIGAAAARPSAEEVAKFYRDNPALFAERRLYHLQELAIEARPDQFDALRERLQAAAKLTDFVDYLRANEFRFIGNQAVRAAEQLPAGTASTMARLKDGESLVSATPTGMQVVMVASSRSQPVDEARAKPLIESMLLAQRRSELLAKQLKEMRAKASIEYLGSYAAPAAPASAASR